jgi:signal transduction histidine kinase
VNHKPVGFGRANDAANHQPTPRLPNVLRLVTGFDGKSSVSVYVQDSGDGIAPQYRDKIFEPFFTTKPRGMGLGLSICRAIAEEHGGELHLSKTDSHGTSFELILPIGSASDNRTAVRPAPSNV